MLGLLEEEQILVGEHKPIAFNGQPCGIVLADSFKLANHAATKVRIIYGDKEGSICYSNR